MPRMRLERKRLFKIARAEECSNKNVMYCVHSSSSLMQTMNTEQSYAVNVCGGAFGRKVATESGYMS